MLCMDLGRTLRNIGRWWGTVKPSEAIDIAPPLLPALDLKLQALEAGLELTSRSGLPDDLEHSASQGLRFVEQFYEALGTLDRGERSRLIFFAHLTATGIAPYCARTLNGAIRDYGWEKLDTERCFRTPLEGSCVEVGRLLYAVGGQFTGVTSHLAHERPVEAARALSAGLRGLIRAEAVDAAYRLGRPLPLEFD